MVDDSDFEVLKYTLFLSMEKFEKKNFDCFVSIEYSRMTLVGRRNCFFGKKIFERKNLQIRLLSLKCSVFAVGSSKESTTSVAEH